MRSAEVPAADLYGMHADLGNLRRTGVASGSRRAEPWG